MTGDGGQSTPRADARLEVYRAVFSQAADPILILDDQRTIVDANPAACRVFELQPADLGVIDLDHVIDAGESLPTIWRELLALGEARHEHRVSAQGSAGRVVECNYCARVHCDLHLCIARDVTERRLVDERLQQTDKIETVARLAGGIAHDFNNLFTAMLGYTELLLAARTSGDPDRADLEEIQKAGHRAAALTQQLLAFSRRQVLLPKNVDLNETLMGLRGMLARIVREDIKLILEFSPGAATVRIDPNQFEQAVLTLVLNARDAMPAGGHLVLGIDRVSVRDTDAEPGRGVAPGDYVRVRVTDTGVGMAPEVRAHLFEPFFTTKALGEGTGLGLASVYGIVRQSNGFIVADSEPGRGSTFTVYLPATSPIACDNRHVLPSPSVGATILLVEDEDAVRVIVSAVLRRNGYQVLEAAGPRSAIDVFTEHRERIALLLTDVVMPEMNGPALAQRLVSDRPELRVLFISGYADVAASAIDSNNPNTGFLSKPFAASVLVDRVREILSRPRPGIAAQ